MIIHAGDDEAASGIPEDIWSALIDTVPGIYDGVRISSAMVLAEDPSNNVINIGIYCHEFFHEFGAPDLYAFDYPVGHWGLMGTFGPYHDNGQHPSHISGYLKWDFDADPLNGIRGWLEPINITSPEIYSIDSFELPTGNRLYKIDIPNKGGKEYFLIENRNKHSGAIYDTYLPESGIVIWHIDEKQSVFFGNPHRAWVEDPTDPARTSFNKATSGAAYSADDEQTSFTPATLPDSSANDGTESGIIIAEIGSEGASMSLTFFSGDTYEPNDSISEAFGPLIYGKKYTSFIQDERDVDFYKFHADVDNTIIVYLENIPENSNYDLQLFDTRERLIATSTEPRQTAEVLSFRAYTAGIHYVAVVSRYGHSSRQHYSLIVDSVPLAPGIIAVSRVYPNPGPGSENGIWFDYKLLARVETITLDIYTPTGERIYTHSIPDVNGTGRILWDVTNDAGKEVVSGIYIYVLKAESNGEIDTKIGKIAIVY